MKSNWKILHRAKRKLDVKFDSKFKLQKLEKTKNTIFVFGVSTQVNYGDLAISLAQEMFVLKQFNDYNYVEVLDYQTRTGVDEIQKIIQPADIIMISGGGNLGNLYEFSENNRKMVIQAFPANKIISFPQSMYYTNDEQGKRKLKQDIKFYDKYPNFILTARESLSYTKMRQNFTNKVLFCPDIVLSLEQPKNGSKQRSGVIAIMRNDREEVKQSKKTAVLNQIQEKYKVIFSDNNIPDPMVVKRNKRQQVVVNRLSEIRNCEFIITDRLHGMIFAAITGTPCIVFNNSNSKVKFSYLDWLKDVKSIYFAEDKTVHEIAKWIDGIKNLESLKSNYIPKYAEIIKAIQTPNR